jgi:hypothetical protein
VVVLAVVIAILLASLQVHYAKGGGGMVYIYYVETDEAAYELGQSVNVTVACYIQYDPFNPLQYSETVISYKNGQICLGCAEWLNETNGYHTHHTAFALNPSDWDPGQDGQIGTVECSLFLQPDGTDEIQRQNFTVQRSAQSCSLSRTIPTPATSNASMIYLLLRVFNSNNPTFGVGSNQILINITNPLGLLISRNNAICSGPDGNFTVSFDPSSTYGLYHIDLESKESERYREGRFNYTLWVERGPSPSCLTLEWDYTGIVCNSSTSYALESSEITTQLMSSVDKVGISDQQLDLSILDSSTSEIIYSAKLKTNVNGFATSNFTMPYEGEFIPQVSYEGLPNVWYPTSQIAACALRAEGRELSIVELIHLPQSVTLNHSYLVGYLVLDALSEKPVPGLGVTIKTNDSLLAEGVTNESGAVNLALHFPLNRIDLIGRTNLLVEAAPISEKPAFHPTALHTPVLCKLPVSIRFEASSQSVFEDGDTIVFGAELVYMGNTPISFQNLTFTVFINQVENPYRTFTQTTDAKGICTVSLKLIGQGVVTIVAGFLGNSTFDSANDTISLLVVPTFHERLFSSGLIIAFAWFLSIGLLEAAERIRRKKRWEDVSIN